MAKFRPVVLTSEQKDRTEQLRKKRRRIVRMY